MAVILEVKAGPFAGKRVAIMGGQTVAVGRTDRANVAVPHDTFMSGVHFNVECGPKGCILTDQSRNGTFVNGKPVKQAALKAGDEVRGGQTVFVVRFVDEQAVAGSSAKPATQQAAPKPEQAAVKPLGPPAPSLPRPTERTSPLDSGARKEPNAPSPSPLVAKAVPPARPALGGRTITIGSWRFARVPDGWAEAGEFGLQRDAPDVFPSSVVATEEPLGASFSLQDYVEAQLSMLRKHLRDPQIDAIVPPKIPGAQDVLAVDVVYKTNDDRAILYRRVYVRAGRTAGVLAFTTLHGELSQVAPAFDAILSGASFSAAANADK